MRFLVLAAVLAAVGGTAAAQRRPDLQILESKARRVEEGRIAIDGRLQVGGKPIKGLVIYFDFISSEGNPLTSQKVDADDDELSPGEESSFHAGTMNPPGAVRYRLRAFDAAGRELRVGNPGPFSIE